MKDFLKTKTFKIILGLAVLMCAFMIRAAYTEGVATFAQRIMGVVVYPFQRVATDISAGVTSMLQGHLRTEQLQEENEQLKEEIQQLQDQLLDYESIKNENQLYQKFLDIKEQNADFEFCPSMVIGRDANSQFGSFVIDKGTLQGVSKQDPVITSDGLIGVIEEVGLTYSRVITIYDPGLNVGAYVSRTRDTGIVSGAVDAEEEGECRMTYLPRDSGAAIGDMVLTSGGNIFPKGLKIGTIMEIQQEGHGVSLYAVVEPFASIQDVKDVFVIISFAGQGIEIGEDLQNAGETQENGGESASGAESPSAEAGQ
ncbi:MAG: rod shape-determining protein MreC [Oscillospiraceae bacterium]|nr:rod shape-determining protein MreC [Oscillospiraceae bacterium]